MSGNKWLHHVIKYIDMLCKKSICTVVVNNINVSDINTDNNNIDNEPPQDCTSM